MSGARKKQEEEELWRNAHDVAVAKFQENVSAMSQPPIAILIPCSEDQQTMLHVDDSVKWSATKNIRLIE
eukprot:13028325-Ditylum_brightwellii.AAC.1